MEYEKKDGVGIFTFDNGKLNVINMETHKEFYHHFLEFQQDDAMTVGVVVGRGENFSAGDDLKEIRTPEWSLSRTRWDHLTYAAHRTKPMISALRGYCLGAGFLYSMLMTDIRIAGPSLTTGAPEIAYGMGGMSGPTRLALQIPAVHAAYLTLTGEKVGAERALEMQLINEIVDDNRVLDRAMEIANTIASHPREGVMVELDSLHRGTELSRTDALHHTHQRYWISRKLMDDGEDAGQKSIEIMKSKKEKDNG